MPIGIFNTFLAHFLTVSCSVVLVEFHCWFLVSVELQMVSMHVKADISSGQLDRGDNPTAL